MLTHEGKLVQRSNTESPTIGDIAYGLGKITRFGGACNGWWTVLHHSLVCHDLALKHAEHHKYTLEAKILLVLQMLLHDAHECITSDIPSTWKSPDMKSYQLDLDTRIYNYLNLYYPSDSELKIIAKLDEEALVAEAYTVFRSFFNFYTKDTDLESKMIVMHIFELYDNPESTIGENAAAVIKYKELVNTYVSMIAEINPYATPSKVGLPVHILADKMSPGVSSGVLELL